MTFLLSEASFDIVKKEQRLKGDMKMKALVFDNFGGPEVLSIREIEEPKHSKSEVIVRMKAIGLNFANVVLEGKRNLSLSG